MRCIFCKDDSGDSKSVEHIVPESLGNTEHTLPLGVVCDHCNNYFARKIEKPLLDSGYFRRARFTNAINNKRGNLPTVQAIHFASNSVIEIDHHSVYPIDEKDSKRFIQSILRTGTGTFVMSMGEEPDRYTMSRFLGKVAIEVLAQRLLHEPGAMDEIIENKELDNLRHYVRRGDLKKVWPFHQRVIYKENATFSEDGYGTYQVLHEYTLLFTKEMEIYLILAVLGVEYALNMDSPNISGYVKWLSKNGNKSPLYP